MKFRPRLIALGVGLALAAVGIPTAVTGAYLTTTVTAGADTALGTWCSVPDPAKKSNVYALSDFQSVGSSRVLIVPVVRSAQFASTEGIANTTDGLGVRLWGCADKIPAGSVRVSAWRGTGAPAAGDWSVAPAGGNLAAARLNPAGALGSSLRALAGGTDGQAIDPATGVAASTSRYSWLVDSTRNRGNQAGAVPACGGTNCVVAPAGAATLDSVFSGNAAAAPSGAVHGNSAVYLAGNYYAPGGTWPKTPAGTDAPASAHPTVLTPPAAGTNPLEDTTGSVLQWVVLEWTGAQVPPSFEIEVFAG
ncbi:hypothetical protein M2390_002527 [Mycetocola sp. BIGb0189]|uniref:hypothetical protein n=1 Tax=Mycetocola sp. BIGb0189 TaxID=2940604 RepID=UPI00216AAD87|nr:hypothetical protein [Mycetocola sp. BIGb0189]MCS4277323.1 hypothetical protein [Mycetocola sp. BIGb0189]